MFPTLILELVTTAHQHPTSSRLTMMPANAKRQRPALVGPWRMRTKSLGKGQKCLPGTSSSTALRSWTSVFVLLRNFDEKGVPVWFRKKKKNSLKKKSLGMEFRKGKKMLGRTTKVRRKQRRLHNSFQLSAPSSHSGAALPCSLLRV